MYARPFWALSKQEQKRSLEDELGNFLATADLDDYKKYFLQETCAHICAGRYELARDSMDDVYRPPAEYVYHSEVSEFGGSVTFRALIRTLRYIKGMPALEYPTFR